MSCCILLFCSKVLNVAIVVLIYQVDSWRQLWWSPPKYVFQFRQSLQVPYGMLDGSVNAQHHPMSRTGGG